MWVLCNGQRDDQRDRILRLRVSDGQQMASGIAGPDICEMTRSRYKFEHRPHSQDTHRIGENRRQTNTHKYITILALRETGYSGRHIRIH